MNTQWPVSRGHLPHPPSVYTPEGLRTVAYINGHSRLLTDSRAEERRLAPAAGAARDVPFRGCCAARWANFWGVPG